MRQRRRRESLTVRDTRLYVVECSSGGCKLPDPRPMASRGARKPPVLLLAALLLLSCLAPAFCDGASTAGSGVGLQTNRKLHTGGRALTGA